VELVWPPLLGADVDESEVVVVVVAAPVELPDDVLVVPDWAEAPVRFG
jgi:hypothetical protein